jgi:hypothetical protein
LVSGGFLLVCGGRVARSAECVARCCVLFCCLIVFGRRLREWVCLVIRLVSIRFSLVFLCRFVFVFVFLF